MKKIASIIALSVLLLSLALAGCSAPLPEGSADVADLTASVKGVSWPEAPDAVDNRLQKALFDFSWDFLQEAAKTRAMCSSPRIGISALSMT